MLTKAEREDVREFFIALYKQGGITDARSSQLLALLDDLDAKDAALEPFIPADIALAAFEDGRLVIMKLSDDTSGFALASFPFRVLRRAAEALGGE